MAGFSLSLPCSVTPSVAWSVTSVSFGVRYCDRWWWSAGCSGRALRAGAPVHDLGLVDDEAVVVGCREAGDLVDRAVDVGDGAARPAHDVVVVVPDPRLVACDRARGLDAAQQPRGGQGAQHVVDRLVRHLAEVAPHDLDDGVGARVRTLLHRGQDGHPGAGHPQRDGAQQLLDVSGWGHLSSLARFLERVKSRSLGGSDRPELGAELAAW